MRSLLEQFVSKGFNSVGLDILRIAKSSRYSLLGLRHLPVRSVVDVGANTGQFARYIAAIFPDAHIYSFEPLLEPFEELGQWADRRKGKVTVFNVALGDCQGTVQMFQHLAHSPSSSLLPATAVCETLYPFTKEQVPVSVTLTTLDRVLRDLSVSPLPDILIKLDVQGFEDRVIRGGQETFRKAKACILEIGVDRLYDKQATFKDLVLLLDGLGYQYVGNLNQVFAADGHVIYIDAVFSR